MGSRSRTAGTWTIQLSVVTATGALTGATSSFDVAPAEDGTGTTVAPPIVTNVIDPNTSTTTPVATAPPGTTGDTTAGTAAP